MVICQNWLWKTEATSGHQASPLHFARCRSSISTDHRDGCHLATMESPWRNSPWIFRSKIDGICWIHGIFGISMDVANYPKPNCCVIFFGFWSISKRTIYLPTNTGDSCAFFKDSNPTKHCDVSCTNTLWEITNKGLDSATSFQKWKSKPLHVRAKERISGLYPSVSNMTGWEIPKTKWASR